MKTAAFCVLFLQQLSLTNSLDLPFKRRSAHRKSVRPASSSNQFLSNSIRSLTDHHKNDVKSIRDHHRDEDIESLFRHDDARPESIPVVTAAAASKNIEWSCEDDEDIEGLFKEDGVVKEANGVAAREEIPPEKLDAMERAWRHCKKPLLRVGSKGAQFTHGNSLRQLLEAHQIVKVKVNTKRFGTLENAFDALKGLAVESGAPTGIEMVQVRDCEKTILFGMPGMLEKIEREEFPPRYRDDADEFPQP